MLYEVRGSDKLIVPEAKHFKVQRSEFLKQDKYSEGLVLQPALQYWKLWCWPIHFHTTSFSDEEETGKKKSF